jgi:hypothetical protein
VNNQEVPIVVARHVMDRQARDPRQGRRFGGQALDEILNGFRRPLYLDSHSGGCIANRASKSPTGSETINVRAESHSLHNA